jgi:hypothetical protein
VGVQEYKPVARSNPFFNANRLSKTRMTALCGSRVALLGAAADARCLKESGSDLGTFASAPILDRMSRQYCDS